MEPIDKNGLTEKEFLEQYQPGDYERPSVAADIVIFTVSEEEKENYRKLPKKELRILLIKRGVHPYLGKWALPGGFVRPFETTEQAAVRELKEETNVDHMYLEQLYTFSDLERDPRTWVISCSYLALLDSKKLEVKAGDDAAKASWFRVQYQLVKEEKTIKKDEFVKSKQYQLVLEGENTTLSAMIKQTKRVSQQFSSIEYQVLEKDGLAFDHEKIIAFAIERLRGKIEYTDIALNLMPKRFTLTELQQVYEVILDKELLKAAFRRKIAHLVQETDHYTEKDGHRPSRLYQRNKKEGE